MFILNLFSDISELLVSRISKINDEFGNNEDLLIEKLIPIANSLRIAHIDEKSRIKFSEAFISSQNFLSESFNSTVVKFLS